MHVYKSRFLVRGEVWYEHEPDSLAPDWIFYRQRSQPVPGARWKYFYTILLDLGQSPEELLAQMSKTAAYKIRRARDRDRVVCEALKPVRREALDKFEQTYTRFAVVKDLAPLDRPVLDQLAKDGFLELSVARSPAGEELVFHAYYLDAERSCLLHTISLHEALPDSAARNAVGRANRYLFWCDILRHKAQGLKGFDFGGWYPGNTDRERLDINRFKEGFGGKVVREYNCEQVLTFKGRVVLGVAAMLNCAKSIAAKLLPHSPRKGAETNATEVPANLSGALPRVETPGLRESELTN